MIAVSLHLHFTWKMFLIRRKGLYCTFITCILNILEWTDCWDFVRKLVCHMTELWIAHLLFYTMPNCLVGFTLWKKNFSILLWPVSIFLLLWRADLSLRPHSTWQMTCARGPVGQWCNVLSHPANVWFIVAVSSHFNLDKSFKGACFAYVFTW